jgi:hypothetical protein
MLADAVNECDQPQVGARAAIVGRLPSSGTIRKRFFSC